PPLVPLLRQLREVDRQAPQARVEQSARQSSQPVKKVQVAQLAWRQPARQRADLPRCRPWETSAPEAGRDPAAGCQEQSPARHRKPLVASLCPRRHNTTGVIDGPIRFALFRTPILLATLSRNAAYAQLFVRTRRP